jgi:hypothetical protein
MSGRAIIQAVNHRLRSQVRLCGVCGGRSGIGAGFLRGLQFLLPIIIPPNTLFSSVIRSGRVGQRVAGVLSGLGLAPIKKNKK